jgi:hypothetical protein
VKYLTESSVPNESGVLEAIKNWEQYRMNISEYEVQFRVCVQFLFFRYCLLSVTSELYYTEQN